VSATRLIYRGPRHWDTTLALELGEVDCEGIELRFDTRPTIDAGLEGLRDGSCDIAEVPLVPVVAAIAHGDDSLTALPVFLSRRFAHRFLWVAQESELAGPADVGNGRVGWAPGSAVAAAWSRDLLRRAGSDPTFVPGAMGGSMAAVLDLGREPDGATLPAAVAAGDLDVLVSPYPVPADEGGGRLRPLIADRGGAERGWIEDGGYFPMITVLALRRDAVADGPGVAVALLDGFERSLAAGEARLSYPGAPAVTLPWLPDQLAEARERFGGRTYRNGLGPNEVGINAFIRGCAALGVAEREIDPAELFAPGADRWEPKVESP
jgi:4,5-dihydroxyphthalate decarboxylase